MVLDLILIWTNQLGAPSGISEFGLGVRWDEKLLKWKGEGFKNQVAEEYVEYSVILVKSCAWICVYGAKGKTS